MKLFIFTFAGNHVHGGKCQPVYAINAGAARSCMFRIYGDQWAFQYTGAQWCELANDENRMWDMEEEMKPIYAKSIDNL